MHWSNNKHFNKEIAMTKEENKIFKNFTKRWICGNNCIDNDVKVRDHCYVTGNKKALHIDILISILN